MNLRIQIGLILLQVLLVKASSLHLSNTTIRQGFHDVQENSSCTLWKYDKYHDSTCVCGDSINNVIHCNNSDSAVSILVCNCMSYDERENTLLVGSCPYFCYDGFTTTLHNKRDVTNMCNRVFKQYREGQMCGRCKHNFAPSPYSYAYQCANCSSSSYELNWVKYLVIAYLPLTLFFAVVIILRFNAMSPLVNMVILCFQLGGSSVVMSNIAISEHFTWPSDDTYMPVIAKVFSCVFGMWNLDMFRALYRPFCLHPNSSILQILSLDYAIAVYPLVLIGVLYVFVKLHDRFEVIKLLWKPAGWLIARIHRQQRTSNSLIKPFGTFLLLSYVKTSNTSLDILMPAQVYNMSGKVVGLYLYYNGSIEYFGKDHLPYGILAIFMFTTFNLVPLLLLCLYPCRCFQSCLNCCRLNSQVLRTFMDAFQGCYKFEPYDCRYWAGFYLFLRLAILAIFVATKSSYISVLSGLLLIPVVCLLAVIRPYQRDIYNTIDIVLLQIVIICCFSLFIRSGYDRRYDTFALVIVGIALFVFVIYLVLLVLKTIAPNRLLVAMRKMLMKTVTVSRHDEEGLITREINVDTNVPLLQNCDTDNSD